MLRRSILTLPAVEEEAPGLGKEEGADGGRARGRPAAEVFPVSREVVVEREGRKGLDEGGVEDEDVEAKAEST